MPTGLVIFISYLALGLVSWILVLRFFPPTPHVCKESDVPPLSDGEKPAFSGVIWSIWGIGLMILVSPVVVVLGLVQKLRGRADR